MTHILECKLIIAEHLLDYPFGELYLVLAQGVHDSQGSGYELFIEDIQAQIVHLYPGGAVELEVQQIALEVFPDANLHDLGSLHNIT